MKEMYEALWASSYRDRDRQHLKRYERVISLLNPSGRVADWGCGHGRLSMSLKLDGMDVVPIDIASNALDNGVKASIGAQFVTGSIHDTILLQPVDYSICTDVLEHLMPSILEEAVYNIIDQTLKEAYFYVATIRDTKTIDGEEYILHPIVESANWWSTFFQDKGLLTYEKLTPQYYECKVKPWTS
jgi:2-polyprenyl-3-methyl-5-hydroxy-6-metoxy-1,4-benzoquinol methylase